MRRAGPSEPLPHEHRWSAVLNPVVTADLAAASLPGAAVHALDVLAADCGREGRAEADRLRAMHPARELVLSMTTYGVCLTWWYADLRDERARLLEAAHAAVMREVAQDPRRAVMAPGYDIYARQLSRAALGPVTSDDELDLTGVATGNDGVDGLTAEFAGVLLGAILFVGRDGFGTPGTSAQTMRDTMATVALLDAA